MRKNKALLILLLSAIISLTGCDRSDPSIVGTWSVVSQHQTSPVDTTYTFAMPYSTVTFNANGTWSDTAQSGTYTLRGSTLSDSVTGAATQVYRLLGLTDHKMILQTVSTSSISQITYTR